jgi:membrane protease YdiL (CAAX protease family)
MQPVPIAADAKSAFILSGIFGVAGAATVPGIMPSLPAEAQNLPLPLPVFCGALLVQLTAVYGVLGLAGFRLSRAIEREPSSLLTSIWTAPPKSSQMELPALAFCIGLCCGVLLVAAVAAIQRVFPGTLPEMLHPPTPLVAMLASIAGSFGEEILFRLFLLTLLLRVLPRIGLGTTTAIIVSALAFSATHAPAFVFLFHGFQNVPPLAWLWVIALNGLCGVAYGIAYTRWGILSAIAMHLGTDTIWHVASQLLGT